MYRDKDKQRGANRIASQRRRDKAKGMTDVLTNEQYVIPEAVGMTVTLNLELCRTCQEPLPKLEKPRKYPGMCLKCVTEKYRVAKLDEQGISKRPTIGGGMKIADTTVGQPVP